MTITIVTDLLDPSCNSYATLADMATYVVDRIPGEDAAEAWNDLSDAEQSTFLVNATRTLDGLVEWIGEKYSHDQRLRWPRINALFDGYYIDVPTLPRQVVEATCETAWWMASNSGAVSVQQNATYEAVRVGPIRIDFNKDTAGAPEKYLPDSVAIILKGLGTVGDPALPGGRGVRIVGLIRA